MRLSDLQRSSRRSFGWLAVLLLVPGPLPAAGDAPQSLLAVGSFHSVVAPGESLRVTVEGSGEPVVLLPGLVGSSFGYRRLRAELVEAGFQAVVIEPLGLGDSPRPERANYSLTAQADRVGTVMEQLHLENVIVVAHAIGASIALRLTYRFPGRVKGLISLDGGPAERAATPGFRRALRWVPFVKMFGGVKLIRSKLRDQLLAESGDTTWVTEAVIDGYTSGHARDLDGTLKAYLRMGEARESEALAPNLTRVRIPVRLLIGLADHAGGIGREEIQLLGSRLSDFTISRIQGAGHFLHEERPDLVLSAIVQLAGPRPAVLGARP